MVWFAALRLWGCSFEEALRKPGMERSEDWARLQAALTVVGELERGERGGSEPESSPEQVAALLVDEKGAPVVSEERARFAAQAAAATKHSTGLTSGDTVRDAWGHSMSFDQLASMRDSKGRPIVIPR